MCARSANSTLRSARSDSSASAPVARRSRQPQHAAITFAFFALTGLSVEIVTARSRGSTALALLSLAGMAIIPLFAPGFVGSGGAPETRQFQARAVLDGREAALEPA